MDVSPRRPRRGRLARGAAVSLVAGVVAVGLAELGLRLFLPQPISWLSILISTIGRTQLVNTECCLSF